MNRQQELHYQQHQQTAWLRAVPYGGQMQGPVFVGANGAATINPNLLPGQQPSSGASWLPWTLFGIGMGFIFAAVVKTPNLLGARR